MRLPTDKDIQEAKEYLRQRLDAELSMSNNAEQILSKAAEQIVKIAFRYNVSPYSFSFSANPQMQKEIEAVIEWARQNLEEAINTLSVYASQDNKDDVLAWINRDAHNSNLSSRLSSRLDNFKTSLEIAIGAALLIGDRNIKQIAKDALTMGLNNPIIAKAQEKINTYQVPKVVKDGFGKGVSRSPLNAMSNLATIAVAEGWMYSWWLTGRNDGAIGFRTFRNSSYPCEDCDINAATIHSIYDLYAMPPLHPHCVCGMVFVYL